MSFLFVYFVLLLLDGIATLAPPIFSVLPIQWQANQLITQVVPHPPTTHVRVPPATMCWPQGGAVSSSWMYILPACECIIHSSSPRHASLSINKGPEPVCGCSLLKRETSACAVWGPDGKTLVLLSVEQQTNKKTTKKHSEAVHRPLAHQLRLTSLHILKVF